MFDATAAASSVVSWLTWPLPCERLMSVYMGPMAMAVATATVPATMPMPARDRARCLLGLAIQCAPTRTVMPASRITARVIR